MITVVKVDRSLFTQHRTWKFIFEQDIEQDETKFVNTQGVNF